LFYPGRPELIGGTKDIPIESIRLKLIREGLEDYEYLLLLSRIAGTDSTDTQVSRAVTLTYEWNSDPENLYSVRQSLGQLLSGGPRPERMRRHNPGGIGQLLRRNP